MNMDERQRAAHIAGDSALQSAVLEGLSEAVNYREWLASLALPWLGDDPIEVGSGLGDYAAMWSDLGHPLLVTEADPARLDHLRGRFAGDPNVRVAHLHAPIIETATHSAVVAYNVLEHIEDDVAALEAFRGLIRVGGYVIILVPAFPVGMSRFDREIGHFRHYRRPDMRDKLQQAGLEVVELSYLNPVGLMAWVTGMKMLGRRPTPGLAVRLYDRMVPTLRKLEQGRQPWFGQSLFAVGRRQSDKM